MRLNVRKCLAISAVFVVIWLVVSYSSMIDVPRSITGGNTAKVMEEKLDRLQKIMDTEFEESSKLLEKVKLQLYKSEEKSEDEAENKLDYGQKPGPILPILVIACDRVTVKRCLDNLVKFRPDKETFPIIVSQDCGHLPTYQVIKSFADADPTITVVKQPDLSPIYVDRTKVKFKGYYKIARHFKFALNHVLATLKHEAVIIVEDDLDISPDFFEYFLGTYPLLHSDPSLWCISAWNDNGKKEVIDLTRPELLHRTDFFPGLGWLLRQETWLQLEPHWPAAFFDDWLRNPENTQGRACIRPEISRTYSFGKIGVSKGLFFDMHLRHMQLNMDYVEFTKLNLTYLLKKNYDPVFENAVYSAPVMTADEVISLPPTSGDVRVTYSNAKTYQKAAKKLGLMDDFRMLVMSYRSIISARDMTSLAPTSGDVRVTYSNVMTNENVAKKLGLIDDFRMLIKKDRSFISARGVTSLAPTSGDVRVTYSNAKSYQKAAKKLGLMDDFRSGIPRAAYLGVVTCYVRGRRVYLAPDFTWHKYDPSWG